MQTVLLTGAHGFIGKHLHRFLLNAGYHVITPSSRSFDFTNKQVIDDLETNYHPDAYILAGFYGIENPHKIAQDVVEKNYTIFHHFSRISAGKPLFYLGSGAEYDKSRPLHKVPESEFGLSVPQDPYGQAKYQISQEIAKLDHVVNLRLFGVYGPGENPQRLPSYILHQLIRQQPLTLYQDVIFDFLYVADLCRIIAHFMTHFPRQKFINVTPSHSISSRQLVTLAEQITHSHASISFQKPGLNNEYTGDNSLLLQLLGNFQFTDYKTGMFQLYQALL